MAVKVDQRGRVAVPGAGASAKALAADETSRRPAEGAVPTGSDCPLARPPAFPPVRSERGVCPQD